MWNSLHSKWLKGTNTSPKQGMPMVNCQPWNGATAQAKAEEFWPSWGCDKSQLTWKVVPTSSARKTSFAAVFSHVRGTNYNILQRQSSTHLLPCSPTCSPSLSNCQGTWPALQVLRESIQQDSQQVPTQDSNLDDGMDSLNQFLPAGHMAGRSVMSSSNCRMPGANSGYKMQTALDSGDTTLYWRRDQKKNIERISH